MTVAEAMRKMILLSDANFHDINHFLKVHAYALTIGACEGLSQAQRYTPNFSLKCLRRSSAAEPAPRVRCSQCRSICPTGQRPEHITSSA